MYVCLVDSDIKTRESEKPAPKGCIISIASRIICSPEAPVSSSEPVPFAPPLSPCSLTRLLLI